MKKEIETEISTDEAAPVSLTMHKGDAHNAEVEELIDNSWEDAILRALRTAIKRRHNGLSERV